MVGLKQILDDGAAGCNIRIDADEFNPRFSGADVRLGEMRPDRARRAIPRLRLEPCRFLRLVVIGEGEGHELVEAPLRGFSEMRGGMNAVRSGEVMPWVKLDADEAAAHGLGGDQSGSRSAEWVENDAGKLAERADERL